jgi:lipid II:glycine glycyltransferase (peptidoglycan interpeptide bridge formation enzyme)
MKFIFTKEKKWLNKWDEYVNEHPKASHLIYSDWLKSYQSYGFDFEVALVLDENIIVGGCGVIIPKFLFFRFYIIPHGPIYSKIYENYFEAHIIEIKKHVKQFRFCYLQLSFPISSNKKIEACTYDLLFAKTLNDLNFESGKHFKYIYTSYGLNWVDLKNYKSAEDFLGKLTPKVRRNIRMPYNKSATAQFLTKIEDIEKAYGVIIENARQAGYSVRSFKEFKNTISQLISKQYAYFIVCKVDGVIKGAAFFVQNSGYITNIMGGVSREKPDIKLGYMLQWEMIKKSFELDYSGYNISMGGSQGVQDFKSKFGAESIFYENSHYYLVLKPFYFKLFKLFDTKLKPYKYRVSKLLSRMKS